MNERSFDIISSILYDMIVMLTYKVFYFFEYQNKISQIFIFKSDFKEIIHKIFRSNLKQLKSEDLKIITQNFLLHLEEIEAFRVNI